MWAWIVIAMITQTGTPSSTDSDLLKTIGDAYDANRLAFASGDFKFVTVEGFAVNEDAAKNDQLSDEVNFDGVYSFTMQKARFERVFHGATGGKDLPLRSSIRATWDGKQTIVDWMFDGQGLKDTQHSPIITTGPDEFLSHFSFPINLGQRDSSHFNLSEDIKESNRNTTKLNFKSIETNNSEITTVVKLIFTAEQGVREYLIDLKRGCIPIIAKDTMASGTSIITWFDDIRPLKNSWLPYKQTKYIGPAGLTKTLKIVEAKVDVPIENSEFVLGFTRPIALYNSEKKILYRSKKAWEPKTANAMAISDTIPVERKRAVAPILPGPENASSWGFGRFGNAILFVISLTVFSVIVVRQFRATKPR